MDSGEEDREMRKAWDGNENGFTEVGVVIIGVSRA